jgi:hypothetical protein
MPINGQFFSAVDRNIDIRGGGNTTEIVSNQSWTAFQSKKKFVSRVDGSIKQTFAGMSLVSSS